MCRHPKVDILFPVSIYRKLCKIQTHSILLPYKASLVFLHDTHVIAGLHTLCAMVEKMPGVAYKALDQFHVTNRGSRQQFFFLNYLEPDPDIDELSFLNMSVLGAVSFSVPSADTILHFLFAFSVPRATVP